MKKFTSVYSVSGCESEIASLISEEIRPFVDDIRTDALGNLIAYKKGIDQSKKLMIAAHMDEIGFVVTYIDSKGFLRVSNIGGISPATAYSEVMFKNGVRGVIVMDASAKSDPKVKDMVIDIGAKDKKDAERRVKVGDTCAPVNNFKRLANNRYTAKAFDDRIGCAVAAYAAKKIEKAAYDTYFVFTVQEEVGLRGAKTAAFAIAPDYGITVDVTRTGDVPGVSPMAISLGDGAAIKVKDNSVICSKLVVDSLAAIADKNGIKYQYEILEAGGTDAASMQQAGAGCHAGGISIPTRYLHTPVEVIDFKDVMACGELLKCTIENGIA